jgi:uncharacterized protein YxjI
MSITISCQCGENYNLQDEYSGQTLQCPKCGAAITVPVLPPAPPVKQQAGDAAFARDVFLLNQKHMAINEKYYVTDEAGANLMFVERPSYVFRTILAAIGGVIACALSCLFCAFVYGTLTRMGFDLTMSPMGLLSIPVSFFVGYVAAMSLLKKRHVTIYREERRKVETLMSVLQESKIQIITAGYAVVDAGGNQLARLEKNYLYNIFRKRWYCFANSGELLFTAKEDSIILSLLRRFLGSFFGLLRTNFIIYAPDETVLGEFNRKYTILDRYVLDMSPDSLRSVDRRVALALGVLLDTGEKR